VGCGAQATFASQKSEANFPQATFDDRSGCDFQPSDQSRVDTALQKISGKTGRCGRKLKERLCVD
jgi:hypothetical protein